MGLEYQNLDDRTRRCMLDELTDDLAAGRLYVDPRLSERGRADYERLLRAAIQRGTEASFADELRAHDRMRQTQQWERSRGGVSTTELPSTTPEVVAESEFHRFYARGLCRRALKEGIYTLVIYRAGAAASPRANSETMVGVRIDAGSLLEDLRTPPGGQPPRGLPQCHDPGLSVRLP